MSLTDYFMRKLAESRPWLEKELRAAEAQSVPDRAKIVRLRAQLEDIDAELAAYFDTDGGELEDPLRVQ